MSASHHRSLLVRAAAVATALPLAGGLLALTAPPAAAAINSPGDGALFDTYAELDIAAEYGPAASGTTERLLLTSPGGSEVEVKAQPGSFTGGTLSYRLELGCWTAECLRAPNGTWTIRQEGGTTDTRTFVTRIAPDAPKDVAASVVGPREAQVTWRLGAEPDLVGWDVYEGSAKVSGVGRSACDGDGDVCSTVISYAAAGSGNHTYTVRALRSTAPRETTTIASPSSASASARLEDSAAPAPGGSDTPSTPAGSGASSDGGATTDGSGTPASGGGSSAPIGTGSAPGTAKAEQQEAAQRKAFALGFSTFGPKLGIPKLPPLPQGQAPAIAPELADGTYEPTLGFEDQVLTERVEVAEGPTRRVRNVVGTALDSERLATSTAGALVLLLAGAHLRRWLGASTED